MKIKLNHKIKSKILKITPFLQKQFPMYDRSLIIYQEIMQLHRIRVPRFNSTATQTIFQVIKFQNYIYFTSQNASFRIYRPLKL